MFDESVTAVFTDMLTRSIPQYEVMRRAVFDLGISLVQPGTSIVDLGCSRGDGLAPFVKTLQSQNRYLGVDVSLPMLAAARERFQREVDDGLVAIESLDLRTGYPRRDASLTLCILTLQFIAIEHRQRILRDAYKHTLPGGAFVLVEKVLGDTANINARMVDLYHARKKEVGHQGTIVNRI